MLEKAISDRYKYAALWLGRLYEEGIGIHRSLPKARQWYETGVKLDVTGCMIALGILNLKSVGESRNTSRSKFLFEEAWRLGDSPAAATHDHHTQHSMILLHSVHVILW